jgi:hypothetical protein
MNSPKPMLNSPAQNSSEVVGMEFLRRVLTRLQKSREARQLAKKTAQVKNLDARWMPPRKA